MTSHPDQSPELASLRAMAETLMELHRDIHDRLRELEAVDDAILGEVRAIVVLLRPTATRRGDQGRC